MSPTLFIGVLVVAATSAAKIPVCVVVAGNAAEAATVSGLRGVIEDEVRRHPGHTPVLEGCANTLHVDLLEVPVAGGRKRFATAYLDGQVPHRVEIGDGATFSANLAELVSAALGSDLAAIVDDEAALDAALGARTLSLLDGEMSYGIEVGQATAFLGDSPSFDPSVAFRVRRGLGPYHIGARLRVAFHPGDPAPDGTPVPTVNAAIEPEFAWFTSPDANISFYLAAAVGITVIRYDGRPDGGSSTLVDWGVHATARMGVEFLRTADFRLDLFASASIPWFVTDSETSELVDDWTPTVEVGLGVAF